MRAWLLFVLLLTVLACFVSAKRGSISNNLFQDDVKDDVETTEEEDDEGIKNEQKETRRKNPCNRKKCYRGERCLVTEDMKAECICMEGSLCVQFRNDEYRHKTCSNKNDTYSSECDLDRDHCLCKHNKEGCTRPGARKIQLDYYGSCKEMLTCKEEEMAQFPDRMRTWLFIVMETLERRAALGEYKNLLADAQSDKNHSFAAIWKFCDLDKDPQDRFVSRRELQYTVRTLRAMEHCLIPFLDECDADDNREITLQEWGHCLRVQDDKITDKCVEIHNKKAKKERRRK